MSNRMMDRAWTKVARNLPSTKIDFQNKDQKLEALKRLPAMFLSREVSATYHRAYATIRVWRDAGLVEQVAGTLWRKVIRPT